MLYSQLHNRPPSSLQQNGQALAVDYPASVQFVETLAVIVEPYIGNLAHREIEQAEQEQMELAVVERSAQEVELYVSTENPFRFLSSHVFLYLGSSVKNIARRTRRKQRRIRRK